MQKRNGGQILIDGLVANGMGHAFCVPGESYLAALDAFYSRRERLVVCRQEGGAAYMAEAVGKLSGRPGVCFVSRGPGAANAMIGVHTAFQDSTPLLLFVGQVPRGQRGREAFQELDYARVYGGVAKAVRRIEFAADIPAQLHAAWAAAIDGRPGPVVVELPEDMLRDEAKVADEPPPQRAATAPTADAVAGFARLLAAAAKPLVIAGGAAWNEAASTALARFAERHNVPVACAFRRQDVMDNQHPNYAGELGIKPNPALLALARDADLVIALAARLGEMTTDGYTLFDVPEFDRGGARRLVHVYPAAEELNSVYRADLAIHADADAFLHATADLPRRAAADEDAARAPHAHAAYQTFTDQPHDDGAAVRMDEVMRELRQHTDAETVIASGAGNYTMWAQRHYQFRAPRTQVACTNGSMGYGVPAGIAAKLLRPHARVVAFSGDGCFLMTGQELATAVQHRAAVIFMVINNHCYGTIRAHQQRHFPHRAVGTALGNPDFAALARAYGAFGAVVRRTEEFAPALAQAVAATTGEAARPALIEIQTEARNADELAAVVGGAVTA